MASSGGSWHTTKSGKTVFTRKGESVQKALARKRKGG
jgi:hypothetical protein